nr:O-antigen ligase family protein [Sulfurovum sp. XGS-02]
MIYLLLFIFAIYSTGSRSAIVMSMILVYIYLVLNIYRRGKEYRLIAHMLNVIVIGVVFYFLFNYIHMLIMNFHGRFDLLSGGEEVRSSTSRALQYVAVYDKIQEAPFFGFGKERNFVTKFDFYAIDNYYFWIILEVGLIGTLLYLLFYYFLIKTALNLYKRSHRHYYLLPTLIGILLIIGSMFLVQPPDNHIYLYLFAGLICVMKALQTNKKVLM